MTDEMQKKIISKNLKRLLAKYDKSQTEVANAIGVKITAFNNWCAGVAMPRMGKVQMLAEYFGVKVTEIIDEYIPENIMNKYRPTRAIPILGSISAGLPLYADEHIEGYMAMELPMDGEFFALKVKGDSMNAARIMDGDIIVVRKQDVVENNDIAVVLVNGDEATVKRFQQNENTVTLVPQSFNPVHQMQIYDIKQTKVRVLGKVVKNVVEFE